MHDLMPFIILTLITCATPGAGVLNTVANAFRYGRATAWQSPVGNAIGVGTMSVISATGLGAVIAASPVLFIGLQAAGALFLIWLGSKSWCATGINLGRIEKTIAGGEGSVKPDSDYALVRNAALLQATNPMLIVYLLSLLPQFISASDPDYAARISVLIALFVGICLAVHLVYSYLAVSALKLLSGPRFGFWLNRVSAVLFWLLGVSVFVSLMTTA